MAQPADIVDGLVPSGEIWQDWNDWLNTGKGIKGATYADLRTVAAAAPTEPFIRVATDVCQLLFYCGDATKGNGGFFILVDYSVTINTDEVGA